MGGLGGHLLSRGRLLLGWVVQLLGLGCDIGDVAQLVGVASCVRLVERGGNRRRLGHVVHALLGCHGSLG